MYYVGLTNLRPAGRFDGIKWTSVGIFEAAADPVTGALGAWAEIDTQSLADYPDPLAPPTFAFSTTQATAASGLWYKVQFRDAFAGVQDSVPEYNGTLAAPTVDQVRAESNADFEELGYPAPLAGDPDRLQPVLDVAVELFQGATGIDSRTLDAADKRVRLVQTAIRMLVEYQAASGQMEQLETAADYDMLSAMSAADYSETRRGVSAPNPHVLHPWPALNRLLNLIVNFDTQGGSAAEAPEVGDARSVRDVRRDMDEDQRVPPRFPRPLQEGVPYWPQPWITNTNIGGP